SCALLLTVSNGAIVYASDSNAKSDTLIENQNGTAQILSANDGIAPTDIKAGYKRNTASDISPRIAAGGD
ncbi:hypothetical protein RFZ01_04280, partial [Acinetobacter pittii]|uniref:hypothetical protein n=1 Tax=Acinetobacter pittii TaxID=48296 RepID=UPI002813427B